MRLDDFFGKHFQPSLLRAAAPSTIASYTRAIEWLTLAISREPTLGDIGPELMREFYAYCRIQRRSYGTIDGWRQRILKLLDFAVELGLLKAVPDIPPVAKTNPIVRTTSVTETAPMDSAALLHDFLDKVYAVERPIKCTTHQGMHDCIKRFERWLERPATIADLSRQQLNQHLVDMEAAGKAPKTTRGVRGYLVSLWNCAFDNGILPTKPERIRNVKVPRRIPAAWTLEELHRIVEACDRLPGWMNNGVKRSLWFRAAIMTAFDTGLRRGDLLALRRDWIGDDGAIAVPMEKVPIEHLVRVRPETLAAINATFPPDRLLVFDWPYHVRMLSHWFNVLVVSAGIPRERHGKWQRIRRTSASHVERIAPGTAGRHLGHLTAGLAQKHYLDPRIVGSDKQLPPPIKDHREDKDDREDVA